MAWFLELLITWFITATALWVAAQLVSGIQLRNYKSAFIVAVLFACLNVFIGWLLWTVLTIASLGLALVLAVVTRVIVNAILLKLTAMFSDSFDIDGFLPAIMGAIVVALTTSFFEWGFENFYIPFQ